MVYIKNKPFVVLLLGAVLVLSATSIENGSKQSTLYQNTLNGIASGLGVQESLDAAEQSLLELPHPLNRPSTYLYALGWLIVAYGMAIRGNSLKYSFNKKGLLSLLAAGMVMSGVYVNSMIEHEDGVELMDLPDNDARKWVVPILFIGGWLLVAWLSAIRSSRRVGFGGLGSLRGKLGMSLLGVSLVLGAVLGVLPMEREGKITDSFGSYMFALGWLAVAAANAMYERPKY